MTKISESNVDSNSVPCENNSSGCTACKTITVFILKYGPNYSITMNFPFALIDDSLIMISFIKMFTNSPVLVQRVPDHLFPLQGQLPS